MISNSTLIAKREIAEGTMEFTFERPEGFLQEAGQSIDLTLVSPQETDGEGNMRAYTIASPPHEKHIRIATRIRDTAFKRVLKDMPLGTGVHIAGPFGSFLLHEKFVRPAVFIAGGIGVTPFHALVLDAVHRKLPHRLFLFLSNRRPEDSPYLDELTAAAKEHPKFTLVPTMTDEVAGWEGERGYINAPMLMRYVPKESEPIYYLAGPSGMVMAMRAMLKEIGVSADDIRFEEFSGY